MSLDVSAATFADNPFVGTRPFKAGERLFGRRREVIELFGLVASERIVLLHSPSGAGKSSVLQAGLVPRLLDEGFTLLPGQLEARAVADGEGARDVPVIRVNQQPDPAEVAAGVANRYVSSALRCLEKTLPGGRTIPPEAWAGLTLPRFFKEWEPVEPGTEAVLIFDQFEEILTAGPFALEAKRKFFEQLGAVLRSPDLHAIFAMREEFVAALEPYRRLIPRGLDTRFRLELLRQDAAREAILGPLEGTDLRISDEAARRLVEDLSTVRVRRGSEVVREPGPFVEPVHLQVVCYRLWIKSHGHSDTIGAADAGTQAGDVDAALAGYYADQVAAIAGPEERAVRDWFEARLITARGTRGQVQAGDEAEQGLPDRLISALIDARLVRAEERRGTTWYELSHDRLIEPIQGDNARWRAAALEPWQRDALLWSQSGEPKGLLLTGRALLRAWRQVRARQTEPTETERRYLKASENAWWRRLGTFALMAIVAVFGGVAFVEWRKADRNLKLAVRARKEAEEQKRNAEDNARTAQVRAAHLALQRGLAHCQRGENAVGLTWLANALEQMPEDETSLREVVQMQLAAWNQLRLILPHPASVNCAAFSPDGSLIMTGCRDGTVRFWDAATGQPRFHALVHESGGGSEGITSIGFHPQGEIVATGTSDGFARLWNVRSGRLLGQPMALQWPVRAVRFGKRDGRVLLTCAARDKSGPGRYQVWDVPSGRPLRAPAPGSTPFVLIDPAPDGRTVLAVAASDGTPRLWDAIAGRPIGPPLALANTGTGEDPPRKRDPVRVARLAPDGATALIVRGGQESLWDARRGTRIGDLDEPAADHLHIAFSPDSRFVATADGGKTVARLWRVADRQKLAEIKLDGNASGLAFSPDGKLFLAAGGKSVRRIRVDTGGDAGKLLEHDGPVARLFFNRDRTRLLATTDRIHRLWDLTKGVVLGNPFELGEIPKAAALSPDGKTLVTGGGRVLSFYDLTSRLARTLEMDFHDPVRDVAFSPDGRTLLAAVGPTVRSWYVGTGKEAPLILEHPQFAEIQEVRFARDAATILTRSTVAGEGDAQIARVWDACTGRLLGPPLEYQADWCLTKNSSVGTEFAFEDESQAGVGLSPDSRVLVTCNGVAAQLWSLEDGHPFGPRLRPAYLATFAPEGKSVVTAGYESDVSRGLLVRFWDAASGEANGKPIVIGDITGDNRVVGLQFGRDGRMLLMTSLNFRAWLCDVALRTTLGRMTWGSEFALLSPDGQTIFTGASLQDGATGLDYGRPRGFFRSESGGSLTDQAVAFSPDGRSLLTIHGQDNTARLIDLTSLPYGRAPIPSGERPHQVDFSRRDGKRLLIISDRGVSLRETETGSLLLGPVHFDGILRAGAVSPEGEHVAVVYEIGPRHSARHSLSILRVGQTQPTRLADLEVALRFKHDIEFTADGRALLELIPLKASEGRPSEVRVTWEVRVWTWDAETGRFGSRSHPLPSGTDEVFFTPDATRLLIRREGSLHLYDAALVRPVGESVKTGGYVGSSRDGSRVAFQTGSPSDKLRVEVYDLEGGNPFGRFSPTGTVPNPYNVGLNSQGTRAVSRNAREVRFYDVATGRLLGGPIEGPQINGFSFHPRLDLLLVRYAKAKEGGDSGMVWDVQTNLPIGRPLKGYNMSQAKFSPDGRYIATLHDQDFERLHDRGLRIWDAPAPPPPERTAERDILWIKVLTGQEVDEQGSLRVLDAATWNRYRARLEELGVSVPPPRGNP